MTKKICKIKNCNSLVRSHGYCNKHDIQMRRHGKITDKEIKKIDGEIWKGITNFKYYEVSNKGRIKSTRCNGEKILKPVICRKGVNPKKRIGLGSGNVFNVHTIVANTFLENKFNDKRVVFKSQDTLECSTDNIEWYGMYWHDKAIDMLKYENTKVSNQIVSYMKGNHNAIDDILVFQSKNLLKFSKYLMSCYNIKHKNIYLEDIVQDSLIKAVNGIKRGALRDTSQIKSWFIRILKNELINEIKKDINFKLLSETQKSGISGDDFSLFDSIVDDEYYSDIY